MENVIVAPEVRELDVLARQLETWIAQQMPGVSDVRIANLAYPFGAGQSHETILFDASWHVGGETVERGCVVRIKPSGFTMFPDDLYDQQVRIMQAMHAHGAVRVAEIFWYETDPTLLGAPFFVMEKKTGRVPVSIPQYRDHGWVAEATPAQRRILWESAVRQLAAIQSVPTSAVPFLGGPDGAREGLAQEWDKYQRFIAWNSEARPWRVLEDGAARLRDLWPDNQPAGIVWGDARLGNMMFDDDFTVMAVMDWEQPSLGGALHDLAWFLFNAKSMHGATADRPALEGMGTREETIALWEDVTGLSAADVQWYEQFTALKYSCLSIRTAILKGTKFPDEQWLAQRLQVPLRA